MFDELLILILFLTAQRIAQSKENAVKENAA
jgi:hypothetical protein